MQGLHILLVDSDELVGFALRRAFLHGGHAVTVTCAADGVEALDLLRSRELPADRLLILTAVNMPRMSGIELIRQIRDDPSLCDIPVAFLTSSRKEADRVAAFELHAAGYFVTSRSESNFADIVNVILGYWSESEFHPGTPELVGN